MAPLTSRQQQVLEFIREAQQRFHRPPTLAEIAGQFGFRSINAAADHVRALRRKGRLTGVPHQARSLQVVPAGRTSPQRLVEIPILGGIPAGFARDREQEAEGCISVDVDTLGIRQTARTFALEVRGESMLGRHILDGDIVVLEHGVTPRDGDVVAALIDNESTLKTFVVNRGKPYLKAEHPRYPDLIPAEELVIQGVMVALIRRTGTTKRS